ncbi:MAG TPA: tetratricopeptide repeat protein [bacterium]|nr:tetratricopeptide repeat protein [bacterium]
MEIQKNWINNQPLVEPIKEDDLKNVKSSISAKKTAQPVKFPKPENQNNIEKPQKKEKKTEQNFNIETIQATDTVKKKEENIIEQKSAVKITLKAPVIPPTPKNKKNIIVDEKEEKEEESLTPNQDNEVSDIAKEFDDILEDDDDQSSAEKIKSQKFTDKQEKQKIKLKYKLIVAFLVLISGFVIFGYFTFYYSSKIKTPISLSNKAEQFFNRQMYKEAIEEFAKNYENSKTSEEKIKNIYFIGLSYYELKDYLEAYKYFEQLTNYKEKSQYIALAHYWKAEILKEENQYLQAIDEYKISIDLIDDSSKKTEMYKKIIEININLEKWDEILNLCNRLLLIENSNNDGSVYYYLGIAYKNTNKLNEAIRYFELLINSQKFDKNYKILAEKELRNMKRNTSELME